MKICPIFGTDMFNSTEHRFLKIMKHEKVVIDESTGEISELNNNFVQLYVDNLDLIIKMTEENPTAVRLFTFILKHMDNRNALVISQHALSEALEVGRTTIHNSVSFLKEKQAIAVFKSGNVNVYAVNVQIAWKSHASGKRYAMFNAKVFISESEQEDAPKFKTQLIGHAQKKVKRTSKVKPNAKGFKQEKVQSNS